SQGPGDRGCALCPLPPLPLALLPSDALLADASGVEDLLGDAARVDAVGPAAVHGDVGDGRGKLLRRDAVVEGAAEVATQLVAAVEGYEGGNRDQAAVALRKLTALPDVAVEHVVAQLLELGQDRVSVDGGRLVRH